MKIFIFLILAFTFLMDSYAQETKYELLNINNIEIQISNNGNLGGIKSDVSHPTKGGYFEDHVFVYSGGFYLTCKNSDSLLWNGVFPSDNIQDYLPGNVGSDPNDERYILYVVKTTDIDFGESWQEWKTAVEFGAMFYDGDNDGIYTPVDLNGNGIWDETEDKPDLIGDYTVWCIYNDGVPIEDRNYQNSNEMGIEIKQTIFAYNNKHDENLSNTIFVRYIIENKGNISAKYDSVFFGIATDPDIGSDYNIDLGGCDTTLNSAYAYKREADAEYGYGENPPAFYSTLLQGPHAYIPGITFIDNNGNGEYNEGIDTPLDSAVINRGNELGVERIPGSTNLKMRAATPFMKSYPGFDEPESAQELLNYLIGGRYRYGDPIVVKDFRPGNGRLLSSEEAENIPPEFIFSGDPVTDIGWQCTNPWDFRLINSTGPFVLKANEPVEIMVAYIVGRGDSPLNSITVTKDITKSIIEVYERNFTNIPVSVETTINITIPNFYLAQNYPNPFNPSTIINYSIPKKSFVQLKVFNILGENISTLVSETKEMGSYEVEFDAENLPSGVYIYTINTSKFYESKKMILLR